jgi:CRP-like cAMP-binding protein
MHRSCCISSCPHLLFTLLLSLDACRKYLEEFAKAESHQIELFLNQVPLLAKLSRPDKQRLVDAFVEESFQAGATIIREGDPGDKFYIIKRCARRMPHAASCGHRLLAISSVQATRKQGRFACSKAATEDATNCQLLALSCKQAVHVASTESCGKSMCAAVSCLCRRGSRQTSATPLLPVRVACYACSGEAVVTQAGKEVNRLFKSDFFGERALLVNEPRGATVAASQATVCIVLDRETFTEILGPLDSAMTVSRVVPVSAQALLAHLMYC